MSNVNMTEVRLLNVPLENDYQHTIYFDNWDEQEEYFRLHILKVYTEFSYQRKDNLIRIPDVYDNIKTCNYVMYKNLYGDGRWVYAFITDMKYINDGMTEVYIETDVMQTYFNRYTVKASFVEREHTAEDITILNTIPEGLELGEYVCNLHQLAGYGGTPSTSSGIDISYHLSVVVGVTSDKDKNDVEGDMYNGIYSGLKYYAFDHDGTNTSNGITALNNFIKSYGDGRNDAIQCMFLAPQRLAPIKSEGGASAVTNGNMTDAHYINDAYASSDMNTIVNFTRKLDGYEPINRKLLTYPYRYLLVTNNNGGSAIYKFEDFYTRNENNNAVLDVMPKFKIEGCLTPGCSIRMTPLNYKGIEKNYEEGINLGKFPTLNWTSDYYTNWITQNSVNIGIDVMSGLANIGTGVLVGMTPAGLFGASMVAGGVSQIAGSIAEVRKASLVPPQSRGNTNCGDIITAMGKNDFHFYEMSIKREYAQIIDDYFNMYGYKTNRVKIPETNHRKHYWYTKTINANIDGLLPQSDLQKIKECYNRGITFWRSTATIQDYSVASDNTAV